jgi:CheY-like chemotaxis protein
VLVAEDLADARFVYASRLRQDGYRVAFAASGEDAVAMARELHPDAVVMDLGLEGKDGWWATRELRSDPTTQSAPIVVVSGHLEPEHRKRAYECGADLFIPKPCPPETLLGVLRGLIAKARGGPVAG